MKHSVLVVGSGGREHALAWKLAQSDKVDQVIVAPGNAGTYLGTKMKNVDIAATDSDGLIQYAIDHHIDTIVVGPETSLQTGISDKATAAGIFCLGPSQQAAQLETSKSFAKSFMSQHNIPTANYAEFSELKAAIDYLSSQHYPLVIKADGLAAGKGVIIAQSESDAIGALRSMLSENQFGEAGSRVIIEDFLPGEELSFIAICDGDNILPLATSRDHKHRNEGDTGPNTGGMGAYSPVKISSELDKTLVKDIMMPVIDGMKRAGTPYVGFLYAGIMLDSHNQPQVLEYNCRLGDPETQPLLTRLESDLMDLIMATKNHQLDKYSISWSSKTALTVVMVAEGYPGKTSHHHPIQGLDQPLPTNCFIFHAGTKYINGQVETAGGRVLGVTALGDNLANAQQKTHACCAKISWPGSDYRRDIGWRELSANSV